MVIVTNDAVEGGVIITINGEDGDGGAIIIVKEAAGQDSAVVEEGVRGAMANAIATTVEVVISSLSRRITWED